MNIGAVAPEAYAAMRGLEKYIRANVDGVLLELVKVRASMVNGCAFCVDMHTTEALSKDESVRRLLALSVWREAPFFSERERAVLALTDEVTRLGEHGVSDAVWAEVSGLFAEKEVADLLMAIVTINGWNRIAVTTRMQPPA
jgi:AhpD family alkylhydroperoxidase